MEPKSTSPQNLTALEHAWNRYVQHDVIEIQRVRPEVANSWQRCRNYKVNPYGADEYAVNSLELRERLHQYHHLVKIARSAMENLYGFVRGSGFEIVLSDPHGYLLEVIGDREILAKARKVQLCPGGDWHESAKGTNAIGTAIMEKQPVQILAWEHFCRQNHFLTCSAAPIFDPEGEMVGVLNISGDFRYANAHTLGMVVAAVNAIEKQLCLHKVTSKLYVAYKYSQTLLESISDGIVSVDNSGFIAEMNSSGGKILGINHQAAKGKHINTVMQQPAPIMSLLATGEGYQDREVHLEKQGKKIFSTATMLRDDSGSTIGAVAVLRESREFQKSRRAQLSTLPPRYSFDDIIGDSVAIAEAREWAKLAAQSSSTILLIGESGTGKELFAQSIHNASPRSKGPFVAVNCASFPEALIESELFGYEEGAFTGAKKGGSPGKFESADSGTLFLDEIGDMPLNAQAKVLRVIQEKKVSRIGSHEERSVDIRIVASTHKNLKDEVSKGLFREDLYYRLNVLVIRLPALRDRIGDIPLLARHLADKIFEKNGRHKVCIGDDFIRKCCSHDWPGNVRELGNAIESATLRSGENGVLTAQHLLLDAPEYSHSATNSVEVIPLCELEKRAISAALSMYEGNILKAAANLGIGRNTLYRKIKEYGIEHVASPSVSP
ncbi:MAG: sigma-54-dependent Fis family transcriptional regulator [Desulfuromonadales bacterium]|nr:sigma-54-dependent Fis family transcriptional regulator [Desulfuromonadales bacterium]